MKKKNIKKKKKKKKKIDLSEAAIQRYSVEKVFWKYAVNLKENTNVEVRFQ